MGVADIWAALGEWLLPFVPEPTQLPSILWEAIRYALFFAVVYVAIRVVHKLPMIREIVEGFNKSRGPIWDMRNTVDDFKTTIGELSKLEPVIKMLRDQMELLDEKIDAAQKQVEELQRHSASERTDSAAPGTPVPFNGAQQQGEDQNWLKLRSLWRTQVDRLEAVIDNIPDGRRARPYRKLTRYDYKPIIERLELDGLISNSVAKASRELVDTFMSYRPRNRRVPDSLIGDLVVLNKQLELEMSQPALGETQASSAAESTPAENLPNL